MNKHWMEENIKLEPKTLARSYLFLTDDIDLAIGTEEILLITKKYSWTQQPQY